MILDGNKGWWLTGITDEDLFAETTEEHRKNFEFTKSVSSRSFLTIPLLTASFRRYLVVERPIVAPFSTHLFPHCAVFMYRFPRRADHLSDPTWDLLPNLPWIMYISKPVAASILGQTFAIPVRAAGSSLRQSIRALAQITVGKGGRVVGKLRDRRMLPLGNGSAMLTNFFMSNAACGSWTGIANTTQQLLHFLHRSTEVGHLAWKVPCFCRHLHVSAGAAITTVRITLPAGDQGALKACLKGVSSLMLVRSCFADLPLNCHQSLRQPFALVSIWTS